MRRFELSVLVNVCGLAMAALAAGGVPGPLPNRVASGATAHSATVLWARAAVPGSVRFDVGTDAAFGNIVFTTTGSTADVLVPVKAAVTGLDSGTRYFYRATDAGGNTSSGTFVTTAEQGHVGFRMGVSGDWRGELAPYPAVRNVPGAGLDLWVSLGDTVYADVASPDVNIPQCLTQIDFRLKHNEVYRDQLGFNWLGSLRASASILSMIDDHEVTNDFAGGAHPSSDPRFAGDPGNFINESALYLTGVGVFEDFNPLSVETYGATGDPRTAGKKKLARTRTYGQDAAVIVLDARSFRDEELEPANPLSQSSITAFIIASFNPARTMLGAVQLADAKADLLAAQAAGVTWKFVMVPEPIQNFGVVGAPDRFEGYAAERSDLLRFIDLNNITNVVFVAADIHGTVVNNVQYQDGPFQAQRNVGAFEVSTGSVAYEEPFGPTIARIVYEYGISGTVPPEEYLAWPRALQEEYIAALIDAQALPLGYTSVGLEGSEIHARMITGGWTATNTYGWTEFSVDAATQKLLVTTWGIDWYSRAELLANTAEVTGRVPEIVSQFEVNPLRACGADFDSDGFVSGPDFDLYVQRFEEGDFACDTDRDGFVTGIDFDLYVQLFEAGC